MVDTFIRHTIRIHQADEPEIYAELKKQRTGLGSIKRLLSLAKLGLIAERMYLHAGVGAPSTLAEFKIEEETTTGQAAKTKDREKPAQKKSLLTDNEFIDDLDPLAALFDAPLPEVEK